MSENTQLTREQAIAFYDGGVWKEMSFEEKTKFQMVQDKLCMPFDVFHEAITKYLGRPVYTHEFGLNREGLMKEVFEGAPPPTLEEIINLIPEDKRIILNV